jgi:hypothetical protein
MVVRTQCFVNLFLNIRPGSPPQTSPDVNATFTSAIAFVTSMSRGQALVAEVGEKGSAATTPEAVSAVQAVAFTTPWNAVESVIEQGGDWTGKIIDGSTLQWRADHHVYLWR